MASRMYRNSHISPSLRSYRRFSASPRNKQLNTSLIADEFLTYTRQKGVNSKSQLLDANQIQRLSQTLGRPEIHPGQSISSHAPGTGTPLPAGYHLVYFTPSAFEGDLGPDGSDRTFNPPSPFSRRMWAGGKMDWGVDNELKVGDTVIERTKILDVAPKKTRDGLDMIIVSVMKTFENERGIALSDRRNWLFRPQITSPPAIQERGPTVPFLSGTHNRDLTQSPVSLFRFSALTFNGHKIHYSPPWCREKEGHRGLVVHGPLYLIHILDLWRDTRSSRNFRSPKSIKYRATSPVYANEPYRLALDDVGNGKSEVKLWTCEGKIGMEADIQSF